MLVAFTASFTVFCHCEPAPIGMSSGCHRQCCEKKAPAPSHGCQGMNAVRLNLQAKQTAAAIHAGVVPMMVIEWVGLTLDKEVVKRFDEIWPNKDAPPDKLSLLQCFRI